MHRPTRDGIATAAAARTSRARTARKLNPNTGRTISPLRKEVFAIMILIPPDAVKVGKMVKADLASAPFRAKHRITGVNRRDNHY